MCTCPKTIPRDIIQVEFVAHPMHLESILRLVSFLYRVRSLRDLALGRDQYHFLTLYSCEEIASTSADLHPRGKWCWFFEASFLLWYVDPNIKICYFSYLVFWKYHLGIDLVAILQDDLFLCYKIVQSKFVISFFLLE